eukprot:6172579-Pleurochrysis_carterae.AAC.1
MQHSSSQRAAQAAECNTCLRIKWVDELQTYTLACGAGVWHAVSVTGTWAEKHEAQSTHAHAVAVGDTSTVHRHGRGAKSRGTSAQCVLRSFVSETE